MNSTHFEETYGISTGEALRISSSYIMTNSLMLSTATQPNDGEFTFDENTGIIHAMKNNTTKRGYFAIVIENISVGDVIVAQMECSSITGTKPKIVMDILGGTKSGTDITGAETSQSLVDYNKWTTIKLSKVHEYNDRDKIRIAFGIGTADTGEYYLRNLKVKVLRQIKNGQLSPEIQVFNVKKSNGTWSIDNTFGANSGANITFMSDYDMVITFSKPFLTNKRPVALTTMDANENGYKYRTMVYGCKHNEVLVKLQNIKDYVTSGTMTKAWADAEDGIYFNLLIVG